MQCPAGVGHQTACRGPASLLHQQQQLVVEGLATAKELLQLVQQSLLSAKCNKSMTGDPLHDFYVQVYLSCTATLAFSRTTSLCNQLPTARCFHFASQTDTTEQQPVGPCTPSIAASGHSCANWILFTELPLTLHLCRQTSHTASSMGCVLHGSSCSVFTAHLAVSAHSNQYLLGSPCSVHVS